jgi:hypothetical protein
VVAKNVEEKNLLEYLVKSKLTENMKIKFKFSNAYYSRLEGLKLTLIFKADDGKAVIEKTLTINFEATPYVMTDS